MGGKASSRVSGSTSATRCRLINCSTQGWFVMQEGHASMQRHPSSSKALAGLMAGLRDCCHHRSTQQHAQADGRALWLALTCSLLLSLWARCRPVYCSGLTAHKPLACHRKLAITLATLTKTGWHTAWGWVTELSLNPSPVQYVTAHACLVAQCVLAAGVSFMGMADLACTKTGRPAPKRELLKRPPAENIPQWRRCSGRSTPAGSSWTVCLMGSCTSWAQVC